MEFLLTATEARVLGALIEKEITTPEYYPLSLNALVNACNQKSSRDPVMQLDETGVREALARLEEMGLAGYVHDSRVPKFEHHARHVLDLKRPEIAVLCLLLLRGPQTAGELRNRSERLYSFDDISSVHSVLERMARAVTEPSESAKPRPALVVQLARRPGEKEPRCAHLLSGEPEAQAIAHEVTRVPHAGSGRIEQLEVELTELRARIERLESLLPESARSESAIES